ncbi:MAG: AMP-binding protein [Gammaproteobacteria bacterium]|nr:AMP-binding protein [Gammaproteobacteria bacterium]
MRAACEADPGGFHGTIAAAEIHWYHPGKDAWLTQTADGTWSGWRCIDGSEITVDHWTPWEKGFDDSDAPFYRWFVGGRTNAAFNEVDRHILAGHGDEPALFYEGDRWDVDANDGRGGPVHHATLSRKELFIRSVVAAQALKDLGLGKGDRIALNMPNILDQIVWTEAAKRLGVIYTAVFGGFSDKTLSDRIENAGARVVITADGASRNAEIMPFKETYTDPALDNFVSVPVALRILQESSVEPVLKRRLVDHCADALKDEITLLPGDVMREVGQVLDGAGLDAEAAAVLRADLAEALSQAPQRVERVIVVRHAGIADVAWHEARDAWAHDLLAAAAEKVRAVAGADPASLDGTALAAALWRAVPPEAVEADHPLFVIYTSGSTGKPKGVVHVHGGYVAGVTHTLKISFDAVPGRDRIFVVADPGWITGQSYLITASLAGRIPGVVTEGAPTFPNAGRFASIIERYGVTIFKAGVTFLKSVMTDPQNRADVERYDLSTLRVATFCAEPTSPAVQQFGMELMTPQYINSYWATEHGGIVWTHPYGNPDQPLRADAHTYPLPWVFGDVWVGVGEADADGRQAWRRADPGEKGEIVVTRPYPYLARTIWGDAEHVGEKEWMGDIDRFTHTYFGRFRDDKGEPVHAYLQGDFAVLHPDGSFSLHGRSDDVINVSGHRLGTEEIEGAILKDKQLNPNSPVGNCIVMGAPHAQKGQTPLAFVLPAAGRDLTLDDERRLKDLVRTEKGAVAVPGDFITVSAFPETRSGKYMRRFLSNMLLDQDLGDTTTLRNPECLREIGAAIGKWKAAQAREDTQRLIEEQRFLRVQYDPVGDATARLATVTITNPPVNALSERLLDELETTLTHIARRVDIGAVVIAGAGPRTFIAGADVRQLLEDVHDLPQARSVPAKAHAVFNLIESMDKPVVAAVEGVALGGGCELAMACHLRVGDARSILGQPEINLFLPPGYGGTQRLPRLLREADPEKGVTRALRILLSGRQIDGVLAKEVGLLDVLATGAEGVLPLAQQLARQAVVERSGAAWSAMQHRHEAVENWRERGTFDDTWLRDAHVETCMAAAGTAGRGTVAEAIVGLVRQGFEQGYQGGLAAEVDAFAAFVLDGENGGRKGIRLFLDKQSPPLPARPRVGIDERDRMIAAGDLLPIGAPFVPGVTPLPPYQLAQAVVRDATTGAYAHADPIEAEVECVVPTPVPGPNQALVYVLASEINYNDIWAITGIPVSLFDEHDEDIHVTGSGGVGLIAQLGEGLQAEGRLQVGQIVAIYAGVSDILDPAAGEDPMFTAFHIQGYQSPDGSHQQFMLADGPQLFPPPADLSLEAAGSYMLPAGTAYRALFRALSLKSGDRLFVEGAASGTGAWAVEIGLATRARVTGMVSSDERGMTLARRGGATVNRKDPAFSDCFTRVPEDPAAWADWERQGDPFLDRVRTVNGGMLCTRALSHAGERAFPRSFQALENGGVMTFFGASSGYHMTFIGKPGTVPAADMLARARTRPGENALIFYGSGDDERDMTALTAIEAAREAGLRIVVVTDTGAERDFVLSLGIGDAIRGVVSLAEVKRRVPEFEWMETMPALPDPMSDAFKEAVRLMNDNSLKPLGSAVARFLRSADNPRGQPDLIIERAGTDSLALSTMLVKANTGRVVYIGDMEGRRYSFYAPQVWMRQRAILMPTSAIIGSHLNNAAEIAALNAMIDAGSVRVPEPYLGAWRDLPTLHQAMWENRLIEATGGAAKAVVNHALPEAGLKSRDALYIAWDAARSGPQRG